MMTTELRYTADRGFKEEYSQQLEDQIRERKENEDKERNMSREYAKQLVRIMYGCEGRYCLWFIRLTVDTEVVGFAK